MENNDKVFVYGTLKKDYGNSRLLTKCGATFLKEDKTKDLFVLGNVSFPYAFPKDAVLSKYKLEDELFKPVLGEVWVIPDDDCLTSLDNLEGVPIHYQRQLIETESGLTTWMYVQNNLSALPHCFKCSDKEGAWLWP